MKVTQTRSYGLFVNDVTNRPITAEDRMRLFKLEASMKKYGYLPFPILVRRQGNRLLVIDGQHRLTIAQKLGLAVQYVETDRDDITIAECASAQSPWSLRDYAQSFAAQGKKGYDELIRFSRENHIPILRAASLLAGECATSGNVGPKLKDGVFSVKAAPYAARVMRMVEAVRHYVKWAGTSNSLGALSRFTHVPGFDDERFISKVNAHPHLLNAQATVEAYSEMYEEVYNHMSRTRLPLAFLAREAAASRSACSKR